MVSVLRTLQAEWNALVPQAQALNIRRVRILNLPLETIDYRRTKLNWLRDEIARLGASTSHTTPGSASALVAQDLSVLTFGAELEFILPSDVNHADCARLINQAGVACRSEAYGHVTSQNWRIVTDGSLGDYARGAEAVSPVLRGEAGLEELKRVCDTLKAMGAKISKRCGLHVHVGASDWAVDTFRCLVALYASAESAIDDFMAPSRRGPRGGNGFCKSLRLNPSSLAIAADVDGVARSIYQVPGREYSRNHGRYCKLNLQSFWQHGTVEFRHHQGTVEADKACNWVRLCLRMALAARDGIRHAETFDRLFEVVKSPAAEKAFFAGRAAFFAAQLARSAAAAARPRSPRRPRGLGTWTGGVVPAPEPSPFGSAGDQLLRRSTTTGQGD